MNRVVEFYELNHSLILLIILIVFGLYVFAIKHRIRNIVKVNGINEKNEDRIEIFDNKIDSHSIVKLKFILTGEVVTCDFARNKSNKYKKPSRNIERIYFDNPLVDALFGKEPGDIIKFKENDKVENDIYVEVVNVNNEFFTDEELEFFNNNNEDNLSSAMNIDEFGKKIERGANCDSLEMLVELLKNWLKTNEDTIGDINNFQRNTKWIELNLNGNNYFINADSTRHGIEVFVKNYENNHPCIVVSNSNQIFNKVTNDSRGAAIKGLYFYSSNEGQRKL